ncbi:hypothetical protein [Streptomyces sp. NPDC094049]|uniref:hypothetical protein n=1 Tax=Streptomyces sp. NPDC094049 TaxID=3154987 RepID=UPI0033259BB2
MQYIPVPSCLPAIGVLAYELAIETLDEAIGCEVRHALTAVTAATSTARQRLGLPVEPEPETGTAPEPLPRHTADAVPGGHFAFDATRPRSTSTVPASTTPSAPPDQGVPVTRRLGIGEHCQEQPATPTLVIRGPSLIPRGFRGR